MDFLIVAVVWGTVIIIGLLGYRKLSEDEKEEVQREIKRPDLILTHVFRAVALLCLFTGIYFPFFFGIGVVLFSISWFVSGYINYDLKRKSSILSMAASIAFILLYFGRYLWDIMV